MKSHKNAGQQQDKKEGHEQHYLIDLLLGARMQPINSVSMSDDLLYGILSFLVPAKLRDARPLSSLLYEVSPRFGDAFLQCLQATPGSVYYCGDEPGSAEADMVWATQNNCKLGSLSANGFASHVLCIVPFLAEMDLSRLKDVDISVIDPRGRGILSELYSILAQSAPLERIQLFDECHICYGWHSLFSVPSLKRVTLNREIFTVVKVNLEALPSLEYLKLDGWFEDLSFESSSLRVLATIGSLDIRINHLCCPSLTRLICEDNTVIVGRPAAALLENAIEKDEFGIQQKNHQVVKVRTLVEGARIIVDSVDYRVAPGCQIILATFLSVGDDEDRSNY